MHNVLFVDPVCPVPYDGNTLESKPQGGTESTVTRIAEALAQRGHRVRITQHNRAERADVNGVEHTPFNQLSDFDPSHVVLMRTCGMLGQIAGKWPGARLYAWYHDQPRKQSGFQRDAEALMRHSGTAILLSDWHVAQWRDCLQHFEHGPHANRIARLYNPIADDLRPDDTPVDPDKFVFFSIPDKGLRETLEFFARFADHPLLRDARLHIASPGYRQVDVEIPEDRVVQLGSLTWNRVIQEMRSAFMVLDYNLHMPEAFGLVHAEADAVGTPWIGAHHGANPEVRSHPDELMDLEDRDAVLRRILDWRENGRPNVSAREEFRTSSVVLEWEKLFGEAS
ncbi:MAG TPA: hypothetical protein VF006_28290 [Longimicrobium sp.]